MSLINGGRTDDERKAFKNLAREQLSQFGEQLVVERTPIIELNSSYGLTALRDIEDLVGSGSTDDIQGSVTTGEIELSTGATASSLARVRSAQAARYIPGFGAELGIGVRIPTDPTGEQEARWGGRSPIGVTRYSIINDGANPVYVEVRVDGSLTGESFGTPTNHTASETAVDSDKSATAITGGKVVFAGALVAASGVGQTSTPFSEVLTFEVPGRQIISLCVGGLGGTSSVYSGFTIREEW